LISVIKPTEQNLFWEDDSPKIFSSFT
jgi:hypothetical protein